MSVSKEREEIREYLIAAGYQADDVISVVWKLRSGALRWTHVRAEEADKVIDGHRLVDTWISAAAVRKPENPESRGTVEDVVAVRALWADLDVGPGKMASYAACRQVIDQVSEILGVQPTVLLASGHGLQPRWRFAHGDITDLAELIDGFGRLVQHIAAELGGKADSIYDLARIIRAPGTTNCKDGITKGIPVKVKFVGDRERYESVMAVELRRILTERGFYTPSPSPDSSPPEAAPLTVNRGRGNRYTRSVLAEMRQELAAIRDWPVGKADERGRGWEKIQADAAYRLAELGKADWNDLSLEKAKEIFADAAPTDSTWTVRDVLKKWSSQVKRAEPAKPPLDVFDDPLSGGYVAPRGQEKTRAPEPVGGDASPHSDAPGSGGDPEGTPETGPGDAGVGDSGTPDAGREGGGAPGGPVTAADRRDGPGDRGTRDSEAVPEEPWDLPWKKHTWDDFGNADRTVARHGRLLRWSPMADRWFVYLDGAWRESKVGGERLVASMIRELPVLEGELYSDTEYQKGRKTTSDRLEFFDFVDSCRSAAKVRAAASMIKSDGELDVSLAAFDNDPMLLNAANGVIELRRGELLAHDPALMLRRQVPVAYDPDAKAPMWESYLERVMPFENQRAYLQRITGYSITGRTSEQAMFLHHGVTHNGKGVYLRVMEGLLGEFSRVVPPTTLLAKKSEAHPTDIMGLEGRRMLQVDEVAEGARLEEATIKRLTGESTITARGMGQDFTDFRIKGKIHMVVNHLPHMGDDAATKRRVKLVSWAVTIPPEERDPLLADRIIAQELPGVLAWAVRGALEWGEQGLATPPELELAAGEYFASEDEFGQWIEEELVPDASATIPAKQLYIRYAQYCESIRQKPMSLVAFGRKLSARGFTAIHTRTGNVWKVRYRTPMTTSDPLDL